jgi:hypothetical protein
MQFTEAERKIYQATDGRFHDPLVVRRALLQTSKGQVNVLLGNAFPDLKNPPVDELVQAEAQGTLAKIGREVFSFPDFNPETGEGALESDCLEEVTKFLEWLAKKDSKA